LHRFRHVAFDMFNVAIFGYTLLAFNPDRGVPWNDLHKILREGQRIAKVQNGVETLDKISTG